jgi:hypothetical protein
MKVIVAGSRDWYDYETVVQAIEESGFTITELVSGGARGVDRFGEQYAGENEIPIKQFIPDWSKGRSAGIRRNGDMADYADALVAVWNGESKGTKNMIDRMRKKGKPVHVKRTDQCGTNSSPESGQ